MAIQGKSQVYLAVFGKHPGWDDHIDDLGIETKRLAEVKRVMYFECIAGNIDSGSWEALDDSTRLSAFAHEFVWRTPGGLVVGRMWSSRDGKGRSKYPMVVVAQCDSLTPSFVASHVMPALAGVQERCESATTAAEVIQIADQARTRLREAMASAGEAAPFVAPPKELASMLAAAGMSGESVGLQRVMYEIDREMAPFRPIGKGDQKKSARIIDARAQHLRVPMVGSSSVDAARFWLGVLAREIDSGVSLMAIAPLAASGGAGYVDLIVGDPGPQQLFCVRAGVKALAPASDVPYTINTDFVTRCKATVAAWSGEVARAPEAAPKPTPKTDDVAKPAAQAQDESKSTASGQTSAGPKKKGFPWFLPVAAVVVVGGALAAWRPWEGSKPNIALNTTPEPAKPVNKPDTKPDTKDEHTNKTAKPSEAKPDAAAIEAQRKADEAKKAEADRIAKEAEAQAAREAAAKKAAEKAAAEKAAAEKAAAEKAAADKKAKEDAAARAKDEADRAARAGEIEKQRDALRRQFVQLDGLLHQAYVIGEKSSEGQSIDALVAKISASPEFAHFRDDTPAARQTLDRVTALQKIVTSTDPTELERHATGALLAEQIAAWSRLAAGGAAWPANPSQLKAAAATVATMETSINDVGGDRGAMLQKKMLAEAGKVWTRYAAGRTDAETLLDADSLMGAFRVAPERVPAQVRYNIEVAKLKRDAASIKADTTDDALRARLSAFAGGIGDQKGAGLDGVLALLNATVSSGVDPTKSGPGAKGWRAEVRDDGRVVAFSWPASGQARRTVEFARVEVNGVTSYLSTTEASIGFVMDAADMAQAWGEVLALLPSADRGDQRTGVRGWEWKVAGNQAVSIQPSTGAADDWSAGWFTTRLFGGMTLPTPKEYYPQGARPPAPNAETPMQYLTVGAAGYIAGLVGCRLPTAAEWSAAAADSTGTPNLRDAAWMRVWENSKPNLNVAPKAYQDGFGADDKPSDVAPAVTSDDGVVWFSDVAVGSGARFKNLVGNVAEFVTESPMDPVSGKAELAKLVDAGRVIGGSAISPAKVDPRVAKPIGTRAAQRVFSDVGFRLAFSAGAAAKPVPITPQAFQGAVEKLGFTPAK